MRQINLISKIPAVTEYPRKATNAKTKAITGDHLEWLRRYEADVTSVGAVVREDAIRGLVLLEYAPETGRWGLSSIPLRDMSAVSLLLFGIPESVIDAVIDLVRNYDLDTTFPVLVKRMLGERCLDCTLTELGFSSSD